MHIEKEYNVKIYILIISTIRKILRILQIRILMILNLGGFLRPIIRKFWKKKKLNIGETNERFALWEWETIDLVNSDYKIDLRKMYKLPFEDESAVLIYSCHLIEHINDQQAQHLFNEIYRILKIKGRVRLACPDIDKAIKAYKNNFIYFFKGTINSFIPRIEKGDFKEESIQLHNLLLNVFACYNGRLDSSGIEVVSKSTVDKKLNELNKYEFAKWCLSQLKSNRIYDHINGYDINKLSAMLKKAGFKKVKRCKYRESEIKDFRLPCFEKSKHFLSEKYGSTLLIIEAIK